MSDMPESYDSAEIEEDDSNLQLLIRAHERMALDIEYAATLAGLTSAQRDRLKGAATMIRRMVK